MIQTDCRPFTEEIYKKREKGTHRLKTKNRTDNYQDKICPGDLSLIIAVCISVIIISKHIISVFLIFLVSLYFNFV